MTKSIPRIDVRPVALFTLFYLVVASVFAANIRNWEFIIYIVVVLLIGSAVMVLHSRVRFSRGVLWLLSIWGLFHMLGGLLPVPQTWIVENGRYILYSWWIIPGLLKYDNVMHLYGYGLCCWGCWQMIRSIMPRELHHPLELILAILGSNGLGAINEVIEFFAVIVLPETNVGGYVNTGWDLIFNLIGSLIAAFIIWNGTPVRRALRL